MSRQTVKLTAVQARKMMGDLMPKFRLEREPTPPEAVRYRGFTGGPDGLEIIIENDWFERDGKFHVRIRDTGGAGHIERIYDPETLERDIHAETEAQRRAAIQARADWVQSVGLDMARRLVKSYWEGEDHEK